MKNFLFLLLALIPVLGNAQEKIEIQGSVTDTSGTRIPYATIRIFALPADSLAGGHVADKNGRFSLLLQQGESYRIEASCISY